MEKMVQNIPSDISTKIHDSVQNNDQDPFKSSRLAINKLVRDTMDRHFFAKEEYSVSSSWVVDNCLMTMADALEHRWKGIFKNQGDVKELLNSDNFSDIIDVSKMDGTHLMSYLFIFKFLLLLRNELNSRESSVCSKNTYFNISDSMEKDIVEMCEKFKVGKVNEKKLKLKKKLEQFILRNSLKTSISFKVPSGLYPRDQKAPADIPKAGSSKKSEATARYSEGQAAEKVSDIQKDTVTKVLKKKKKTKKKKTKKKNNLGQGQFDERCKSEKIGQDQGRSSKELATDIMKVDKLQENPAQYTHLPLDVQGDLKSRPSLIIQVNPLSKEHVERHFEAQNIYGQFKKTQDQETQWESTEDLKFVKGKFLYARIPTYSDAVKTPQKFFTSTNNYKKVYGGKTGPGKGVIDGTRVSRTRSSKCDECKPAKSVCECIKIDVGSVV
jgi:hypothetical protein